MDLRLAVPETTISAEVLEPALEAITRLDEKLIREGTVPTFRELAEHGRVKWKPEPPGAERFDHAKKVVGRGWGDCDDLAPYHAASLRVTGEDPGAEAGVYKSGPGRWHAIVHRSDGSIDDPSVEAGMRKHKGIVGIAPPVISPMFPPTSVVGDDGSYYPQATRPALALRPGVEGVWEGRADMPWTDTDYAISVMSKKPVAAQSLVNAIAGALLVGEVAGFAEPEHCDRLRMIAGLLNGHHPHELAEVYGEETLIGVLPTMQAISSTVGFNFGKLLKSVAPFVAKAVSFIPGVGPIASSAIDIATGFIKEGGGGGAPLAAVTDAVKAAAAHPAVAKANAQNIAHAQAAMQNGHRVHPGATMSDETAPRFTPIPKQGAGYIHVPGGPIILRF